MTTSATPRHGSGTATDPAELPEMSGVERERERQREKEPAPGPETDPHDRPYLPWRGKATRTDKALLCTILGVFVLMLALWPLRPFLIASHPVLLAFATGSKAAIGAVAAYAEAGRFPLWLAIVAGTVGMAKFDWLFWWTGRLWGRGVLDMFARGEKAQRLADRAQDVNPWLIRGAVVLAFLPGIPSAFVYALAGWTGMRLGTFLLLDLLSSLIITGIVAGAGYALGPYAVDVIIAIDDKAIWVSIGIALLMAFVPTYLAQRKAKKQQ